MNKIRYFAFKHKALNKLQKYCPFINADKMMYDFIEKEFSDINKSYSQINSQVSSDKPENALPQQANTIWLFWWQRYESAPALVKKCIESVKKNAGQHEVVVLTKDNWTNYAQIPDYITKKLSENKITLTHFSDILRMELLSRHGGLWLDATIFVSKQIPESCFTLPYFTVHYPYSNSRIAQGKWTGFCQGAKQNQIIQTYCRDIFFAYWKKHDSLIDYFFIDYVMRYGYDHFKSFKTLVDSVPENNTGIKELDKHFNDEYLEKELTNILKSAVFFKLNWKRKYALQTADGKDTIYAKFLNEL